MACKKKTKFPLHEAVEDGNEKFVQIHLEIGYNVNDVDSRGKTPLHYTATRPYTCTRHSNGRSIEFIPMNKEDVECRVRIANLLINAGADVESLSKTDDMLIGHFWDSTTALQEAALCQNDAVVEFLLKFGADVHAKSGQLENTALHCAMFNFQGNLNLVKILLDYGAQVNAVNRWGELPLHVAVQYADAEYSIELIELFLEHGVGINAMTDGTGNTALHLAVIRGNVNFVKILLEHGSDVNAVNNEMNETPLHLAAKNTTKCSVELIKLLLEHGADVNKKHRRNDTASQTYIARCQSNPIDLTLLKLFHLGKHRGNNHMSQLHEACLLHKVELVRDLLQQGADLTVKDSRGNVPMFYALTSPMPKSNCKWITMRLLLDYGADGDQRCLFPEIRRELYDSEVTQIFWNYATDRLTLHYLTVNSDAQERQKLTLRKFALPEPSGNEKFSFKILIERYAHTEVVQAMFSEDELELRLSKELRLMKNTKIGKSEITFLDFFDADIKQMVNYTRNKQLVRDFEAGKDKFKQFKGILEASFYRGYARMKLIKSVAESLSILLCSDCSLEVYFQKYLGLYTNEELNRLME